MADTPIANEGDLTDVTPVVVLSSPASGAQRIVPRGGWSVHNRDTAARDVTFQKRKGANVYVLQYFNNLARDGTAILDKVVVLDATDEQLENICDAPNVNQPQFDIAAMETT